MFLKIKKIVRVSAAIVLVVSWFALGLLVNSFVANSPRSPSPEEGKTVPYEVKGIVVFITEEEQRLMSRLFRTAIGSGLIFVLVILIDWVRSRK
jgi:hypothetical protein